MTMLSEGLIITFYQMCLWWNFTPLATSVWGVVPLCTCSEFVLSYIFNYGDQVVWTHRIRNKCLEDVSYKLSHKTSCINGKCHDRQAARSHSSLNILFLWPYLCPNIFISLQNSQKPYGREILLATYWWKKLHSISKCWGKGVLKGNVQHFTSWRCIALSIVITLQP